MNPVKVALWFTLCFAVGGALGVGFVVAAHGKPITKLQRCMVYLPAMQDAKLKRWCLKQSERMP